MATVIDAFLVTFGLDSSGMQKGAEEGKSSLEGLKSTALKVFAVIGGAVAVKAMISNFADGADAAGKLADALGEDMEQMQALGRAAALEGGSVEQFNGSIKNLNRGLVEMATTGGGRSAKFFEALGISATDATGKVRPATEVLLELSDRFEGLSAQEAAGLGEKLGLDAGTIGLLRKGRVEIEATTKAQKELGVYTKEDAAIAAKFNDQIQDMGVALGMVAAPIIQLVLPALEKMAEWVKKGAIAFREQLQKINGFVKEHGTFIVATVGAAAAIIAIKYRQAILQATAAMIRLGIATVLANLPLYLMIAAIAMVSAFIGLLIEDFVTWRAGGESAIGALLGLFAQFRDYITNTFGAVGAIFLSVWDLLTFPARVAIAALVSLFTGDFSAIKETVLGLGDTFATLWESIKTLAAPFFTWISEKFDLIKAPIGWITSKFGMDGGGKGPVAPDGISAKDAISPAAAAAGAGAGQKNVTASQSVGEVNIYTGTTDVAGVASSFSQKTGDDFKKFVMVADSGVPQ